MDWLWIGIGGFVGALCRYALGGWIHRVLDVSTFPVGTLSVNLLGCLGVGVLMGLVEWRQVLGPEARALLILGFAGSFTTFSTFGFETFSLLQEGRLGAALVNVGVQVGLGLVAVWAGFTLIRVLS